MGKTHRATSTPRPQAPAGQNSAVSLRAFLVPLTTTANTRPEGSQAAQATPPPGSPDNPTSDTETTAEMLHTGDGPDWATLLARLPTKEDLKEANAIIMAELQQVRGDLQGLHTKIHAVEATCDVLNLQQAANSTKLDSQNEQLRGMALHMEDLDNRGRRNNLRIRGLPDTEDSPTQLIPTLTSIFNTLLDRPNATPIAFVRAHRALRPRGTGPPRDVICCLESFPLKEDLLRAARAPTQISHDGVELQLFPDLSPATLAFRRALRPLTRSLQAQKIRYRWHFPTGLLITTPQGPFLARSSADVDTLVSDLQLPPVGLSWPDPVQFYSSNRPGLTSDALPQRPAKSRSTAGRHRGSTN
uniref:Uncharacterized protein n=1 Tax=Leptobrachium leishanense TaxID=445787 RepID=A0A8C5LRC0_9ANUR